MSQLFYYIKQETLGEHNPSTGQRTLWALFTCCIFLYLVFIVLFIL